MVNARATFLNFWNFDFLVIVFDFFEVSFSYVEHHKYNNITQNMKIHIKSNPSLSHTVDPTRQFPFTNHQLRTQERHNMLVACQFV